MANDKKETKLVTFNADFYPYVFGDVVEVETEELKRIDKVAKARGIDKPYSEGSHKVDRDTISTPTGDSEAELARARAEEPAEEVQEDPNQTTDEISEKGQAPQAKRTENLAKK